MKQYTLNAAEKAFSDKAAELLNQGYQVLPCGMSGHQGEVAKITFTKNNRFFVLYLKERKWSFNTIPSCKLIFAEAENGYEPGHGTGHALWIDRATIIETTTFYELGDNYSNRWTADKEFAEACRQKSRARAEARSVSSKGPFHDTNAWKKAAWKILKKAPGCKTGIPLKKVNGIYFDYSHGRTKVVIEVNGEPTVRKALYISK